MDFLIRNSIASSAVGGDSKAQRQGVISSIAIYLNGISSVENGTWTIREFLDSPGDSRLYILNTQDTQAMFAPLFRLMLAVAFSAIEAKQEVVHYDRYWFGLDESHTLGDIRLDEKLATLRKYGVCAITGIQSDQQFEAALGEKRAGVVMNCFGTVLGLRADDDRLQERIARRIGKLEETVINRNQQFAPVEWRDGGGLNQVDREKFVVMPSEIGKLDPGQGYLKLVGSFPTARVDYSHWYKASFFRSAHVNSWREVNRTPERDPKFLIRVAESDDVFALLRGEVQVEKERKEKEAASEKNTAQQPVEEEKLKSIWRRVDDDPANPPGGWRDSAGQHPLFVKLGIQ